MPQVESSAVIAVEYVEANSTLIVTFTGGGRYAYAGVSCATYQELLAADSIGRFVNATIKPNHKATRLPQRGL